MDEKRVSHRLKRQTRRLEQEEGGAWDCSVCTYRNTAEAFKCSVCDVRKGTATRKPRLNPSVVQQQVTVQQFTAPLPKKEKTKLKNRKNGSPRLKNIDRKSGQDLMVTVGDVTVVITDYKPKEKRAKADPSYLDDDHALVGGPDDSDDRAEESMDHSNNNTINTSGTSSKMTSSSDEDSD